MTSIATMIRQLGRFSCSGTGSCAASQAPWLLPAAVEEALRWEGPAQRTWHIVKAGVAPVSWTVKELSAKACT